ncbi:MFS general substrate transporter, partial [Linderina pennispora]
LVTDSGLLHHKSLPIPATVLLTEKEPPEPDSKYGWLVILGTFIIFMFSVGLPTTYGIFIHEYILNEFPEAPAALISWIGTLQVGIICIFDIFVDSLCEIFDTHLICSVGSDIARAALIIASFCNSLAGPVFTQGILFGLGDSSLYVPGLTLVPQWLVKHRSFANSIAISSAGVGGLWLPVAMRAMIQRLGRHWALQTAGIVIIVVCGACSLLMKVRVKFERRDKIIDFSVRKDSHYISLRGCPVCLQRLLPAFLFYTILLGRHPV